MSRSCTKAIAVISASLYASCCSRGGSRDRRGSTRSAGRGRCRAGRRRICGRSTVDEMSIRAFGSLASMKGSTYLSSMRDIEGDVVADDRAAADEAQQLGHQAVHLAPRRHILRAELVDLDRGCRSAPGPALTTARERLARRNDVAADADRGDRDDVVAPRIEAGRLAVERQRLRRAVRTRTGSGSDRSASVTR